MSQTINSGIIDWANWTEDMLKLTDEFAKHKLKDGTPEYEFQQGLIRNAKRFRECKCKK